MSLHQSVLSHSRKVAVETAEAAGALVCKSFGTDLEVSAKGAAGDVVTSLDLALEELIVGQLHRYFPSHCIVTEERGELYSGGSPWTWLVDPLDGSNNIAIGLPVIAIGLALCHERVPVLGVVHEPITHKTWSAVRNEKACDTDGELLRRPLPRANRRSVVAWTQGYGVGRHDLVAASLRAGLQHYSHRVLELWAPLTSWAMLARGDIDGIIGYRIGELDLHAGALIAAMTGIEIREFDGAPFDPRFGGLAENRSLVAAVPERLAELLAVVSSAA
jgi:myo-inositol-1(or 4)-monophosphatase